MQFPKYESYFIINKRRQYEKSTISSNSLQLPYKYVRDNLQSGKRLSVTSRCHRILWEKDKENIVLGGVKSYLTGRKIAEQHISLKENSLAKNEHKNPFNRHHNGYINTREDRLRDNTVSYENSNIEARKQLQKGFNQMTKSLYSRQQVQSEVQVQAQLQIQIQPVTQVQSGVLQKQQYPRSRESIDLEGKGKLSYPLSYRYNYEGRKQAQNKISESIIDRQGQLLENSLKVGSLLENSIHLNNRLQQNQLTKSLHHQHTENKGIPSQSDVNNNENIKNMKALPAAMDSSKISHRSSKKSRILQFKQQFNTTLEQQQIIQTQVIPHPTANDHQSSLKSFTKDELCSSFYDQDEQHLPHRLLMVNSARKQNMIASNKKDVRHSGDNGKNNFVPSGHYAMTVREHSAKGSSKEDVQEARSMKEKERVAFQNHSEVHSGQLPQQKVDTFNFSNILTHQSQLIKPSAHRHSEQVIPVNGITNANQAFGFVSYRPGQSLSPQHQTKNQPTIHMGQSFQKVLDLNPKPCESFILETPQQTDEAKPMSSFLQVFYQQQLKRRSQANEILKSLINMKMINETMEFQTIN